MDNQEYGKNVFQNLIDAVLHNEYQLSSGKNVLELPFYVPLGKSIVDGYNEFLEKYKQLLTNYKEEPVYAEAINSVNIIGKGVLNTIEKYLNGDVFASYSAFKNMFDEIEKMFPHETVSEGRTFYRMRATGGLHAAEDFYHIPYDKIHLSKSERFSIAGYPCLYLGYSKHVCELEISKGSDSIAKFVLKEPIGNVLDLTLGQAGGMRSMPEEQLVKVFPLIAACYIVPFYSSINGNENRPDISFFREEYIIPQLLTAYLREKETYNGIIYYSVKDPNLKTDGVGEDDLRNIVLFTNHGNESYDKDLMRKFEITL